MSEDVDNFLAHHGVLGMKWGRHNTKTHSQRTASGHKKTIKQERIEKIIGLAAGGYVVGQVVAPIAMTLIENKYAHKYGVGSRAAQTVLKSIGAQSFESIPGSVLRIVHG